MNKTLIALLALIMTTPAIARDYFDDPKYTNPRPRGVDSVYDEPRRSPSPSVNYYSASPAGESASESTSKPSRSLYGTGSTTDGFRVDDNGLIIGLD